MKSYDVTRLPTMITLGYDGENNWRPNSFDCSSLLANHPNGALSLWLLPNGESQAFPVALERDGNTVVWTPLSEEMTAATGAFQIVCTDGTDVGKSAVVLFRVGESILPGADHPAAVPSWATQTIERAESAADRAEEAAESIDVEHLEQIIAAAVEAYLIEHPVEAPVQSVNGKTGAVNLSASDVHAIPDSYTPPVESVNGKTGAVVLDAEDVGALPADTPIPAAVTEQTVAGWGFTKNTGTYSKPSDGIPASDLTQAAQTSLGKADTALQPSGLSTAVSNLDVYVYALSVSGTSVSLATSFTDFYNKYAKGLRPLIYLPYGGGVSDPIAMEMRLIYVDALAISITLRGEHDGNRYEVTLSASSYTATPMTGTLVTTPLQELPSGGSVGDFLRKTANGTAWQTVPSAESNSFGGA